MHITLRHLRIFEAVARHGSISRAAGELHLTQPAVTKSIAGLEAMLGVKLFDRAAHGVEPTLLGLSFAPRAVAIFDELRRAAQDLALVSRGEKGTLRVGIVPMPAIPFLPVAVGRLADEHPNIFVSVVEDRETELVDRLRSRDVDIAILRLSLIDAGSDMQVAPLFDEQLCIVASKDHPLAGSKHLSWAQLLQERWIMPPADCYFYAHVHRTLARLDLELPRHIVEAPSIHIQFGMVMHAGMLGFGMRSQVSFAPGKEFLVRLPFELPFSSGSVGAVTLKSHALSPLAELLIGHIRDLANPPAAPVDAPIDAPVAALADRRLDHDRTVASM